MKKILAILILSSAAYAQSPGERYLADYFERETRRIEQRTLQSLDDWKSRREQHRRELLEMLGLAPMPPRTDLRVRQVGKIEADRYTVEKLHFQSSPGLYVTANLYVPKGLTQAAPAVLYLCGHARVVKDGVAYGNKSNYQHHPAWFAENGYVSMIIDTLDLGEIEGEHHGTSRKGWWWWPSRGYTPAGVETWNAIRALDYLSARPEVDARRIGVTGRSGGGAYTWFLAAVDDRPSVLVPVAGITDMRNHVVDGAIEGHCDCMYMCNTYAWDFGTLAALLAPRPLLLANSDKDRIFPLDGVQRIHAQLKRIYALYGAQDKLGLFVSEGPHSDTQELQVASFRWMNRWLKNDTAPIDARTDKPHTPENLKIFPALPSDQMNTQIHDTFVPSARDADPPASKRDWEAWHRKGLSRLESETFRNSPLPESPLRAGVISDRADNRIRARIFEYAADDIFRLRGVLLTSAAGAPSRIEAHVLGPSDLGRWSGLAREDLSGLLGPAAGSAPDLARLRDALRMGTAVALLMPRGVGPSAWPAARDTHIRRRFLLLGQSLEAVQSLDSRRGLDAVQSLFQLSGHPLVLKGSGPMSLVALLSGVFRKDVTGLEIENLPLNLTEAPALPNLLRNFSLPQLCSLALPRSITIRGAHSADWRWTSQAAEALGGKLVLQ